jgi:uncharacterized membrane protein (UPF0127 family)
VLHRRVLIAGLFALGLAACAAVSGAPSAAAARNPQGPTEPLEVVTSAGRTVRFKVEVVDTPASRELGLMFRRRLAQDAGMLFDFKSSQDVAFWMKNTFIPLDIVFIRPDGTVANIARKAKPFDETPLPSDGPVLGVLEINGGEAARIGLKAGDLVRHRIFGNAPPRG